MLHLRHPRYSPDGNEIPDNKMSHFYNCIRVPYKSRKIVEKMSRNKSIMAAKQDKRRGVAVIARKFLY